MVWPEAWGIVTDRVANALRGRADPLLAPHAGPALLSALDEAKDLAAKAQGVNADKTHTALVLGRTLGKALRAGR